MAWLSGYTTRKKITISSANVDSVLTDFPLLVKFADDTDIAAGIDSNGYNIRFTLSDGETELDYERQSFTSGDADGIFWVKVPTISSVSDTEIYIYYKSSSPLDGEDATNVWDSNFAAVLHCHEDANDSTSNGEDFTEINSPSHTSGLIGNCYTFNGSDQKLRRSTAFVQRDNYHVSMWIKTAGTDGMCFHITDSASADGFGSDNEHWMKMEEDDGTMRFQIQGATSYTSLYGTGVDDDAWHQVWGTFTDSTNARTIGVDGLQRDSDADEDNNFTADYTVIGGVQGTTSSRHWGGEICEVRVTDGASGRSAAWMKFEYYNISESDNELTFGSEEETGTVFTTSNWLGYDKQSATNPAATLTDFTLLINIADLSSTWKSTIQSDFGDLRVTKGDNTELAFDLLNPEYNGGSPTGWIRALWTGDLEPSGTQEAKVWAGYTPGTALTYHPEETYGQYNAYDSNWAGYWANGGDTDRTVNQHHGTDGGTVSSGGATGKIGEGTDYPGGASGSHYVTVADQAEWDTQNGTVMAWFKTTDSGSYRNIMRRDNGLGSRSFLFRKTNGNKLQFQAIYGGNPSVTSSGNVNDGSFFHGAARWEINGSNTDIEMFLDGSSEGTGTATVLAPSHAQPLIFGGYTAGNELWDDILDDLQFHNINRSDDWISEEYAQANDNSSFWGTWAWTANESVVPKSLIVSQAIQRASFF